MRHNTTAPDAVIATSPTPTAIATATAHTAATDVVTEPFAAAAAHTAATAAIAAATPTAHTAAATRVTKTVTSTASTTSTTKKIATTLSSIFFILILWQIMSMKINSVLVLPSPLQILKCMPTLIKNTGFWENFFATFIRVIISFLISLLLGFLLGFITAYSTFFQHFFKIPLQIIRIMPVIAIILIALFWFSSDTLPVFVAVLMNLPVITTSVQKGFQTVDDKKNFMAKIYRVSKIKRIFNIDFENCLPFIASSMETTFGLSWKVVVAGEVLSLPSKSIGKILSTEQINLETAKVLTVTLLLITLSYITQKIFKGILTKICRTS